MSANFSVENTREAERVDVSVVLPTFNERDNICDLVDSICRELQPAGYRFEVLVVDDSSPDGTAEVVRGRYNLGEGSGGRIPKYPGGTLRLFVRTQDKGLAASIRDGDCGVAPPIQGRAVNLRTIRIADSSGVGNAKSLAIPNLGN